ncbi:MAG: hypothetical protein RR214_05115, partial [Synergistaceae bacterium]
LCNRLLCGHVSGRLVPIASIGISAATFVLYFFSLASDKSEILAGAAEFVSRPSSWGVMGGLFMLAVCGGIFSVPMYAIMQARSSDEHRARVVACLNVMNSFYMVMSAVFVAVMLLLRISIINIFLIMGVVNLLLTPFLKRMVGVNDEQ